ncbi:pentatricopeptide repeat-containing protein At1g62930, chloroplastic-like [Beta vulgaris subsp. vulgaris]|uniref:pentatricopeptide repeat-containing protein At1g62930, chloroplastic-like n=1 Tax=Beta vulgaris subsp. vulgaris TaxID=3555 RepID=UPI002548AD10|nr:pentatricopeptide repeat-containing protein At1g62930, chloroplastic-like [Beta vulgaris subsp. vulgaris]
MTMKMKLKFTPEAFAAFFHGGTTLITPFTSFHSRNYYSIATDAVIQDRQLFLHSVREHCLCRIGDNAAALHLLKKMQCVFALKEALDLFTAMKSEGIKPDVVTYTSLIRGLYNSGSKVEAKDMLAQMLECNIAPSVITFSMLVDMFCKDGNVDEAQAILDYMIERAYAKNALLDEAVALLEEMEDNRVKPNVVIYNI